MRPDDRDLDEEIRSHLALSAKDRVDRGETPEAARLAALREFGYVPAIRDSMRRVRYTRGMDRIDGLWRDIRIAWRSLRRAPGLAATVVITLALGIGANAAIVRVARSVLLRPLVNRGEDRLLYLRQTAPGVGGENVRFSVPEVLDLGSRAQTIEAFGDFSTVTFTLIDAGEPRVVRAGVVNGSFFDAMGLRPILGRLLRESDDGPDAASVVVLTHRFWTLAFGSNPSVIGRTLRLGPRDARVVGVLEPAVPYPAETEIIANVVTSPHHLEATMTTSRTHRMTELFGRLREGASIDAARADLIAAHAAMMRAHPEAYAAGAQVELRVTALREQLTAPARPLLILLLAAAAVVFVIACSNAASLVLCGGGAVLGVALAFPLVAVIAHLVARLSARALEVSVDASLFPGDAALGRMLWWTDPVFGAPTPRRIVGIVGNVDDERVAGEPAMTVYHPLHQIGMAGRLFVRTSGDPYSLVEPVARVVREVSATQPVERAATLEDVRAEVLEPDRLNAVVLSGFAGIALLIAAVGVAGVLAFSVSARSREFGVRLAVGSTPRQLLVSVLAEGALIAGVGIAAGAVCGYVLAGLAARYVDTVRLPGVLPAMAAAAVLAGSALVASLMPAVRAARVDVSQALRSE